MTTIGLNITPEDFNILKRTSQDVVIMKRLPKSRPDRILFYATKPYNSWVGHCGIKATFISSPLEAWERYDKRINITRTQFDYRFGTEDEIVVFELTNVVYFNEPVQSDYSHPGAFRYVRKWHASRIIDQADGGDKNGK